MSGFPQIIVLMTDAEVGLHLNPPPSADDIKASSINHLVNCNTEAAGQIARIQERIDTIGFGIEVGEATEEDEAEQAALLLSLKAWKTYKFALGKVTSQPTWYAAPVWPVEPPVPVIVADPEAQATDSI